MLGGIGPCVLKGGSGSAASPCKVAHVDLSHIDSLTVSPAQFEHGFDNLKVWQYVLSRSILYSILIYP